MFGHLREAYNIKKLLLFLFEQLKPKDKSYQTSSTVAPFFSQTSSEKSGPSENLCSSLRSRNSKDKFYQTSNTVAPFYKRQAWKVDHQKPERIRLPHQVHLDRLPNVEKLARHPRPEVLITNQKLFASQPTLVAHVQMIHGREQETRKRDVRTVAKKW